ncbi:hypothetical protein HDF26_002354 [Pedobacter cryoconitis]|uniref:BfmA/BtgA family mobilization protein n=1 Tax=Pedobacter cryoconitis TaxID=188932 RepID=UPI00160ADBB7|nr:BfmA/BtgA family mobilization protein [Pedobacter cryoconitis]MBB6271897.1 hypothetical protein [Pedobacter cryoconitis]
MEAESLKTVKFSQNTDEKFIKISQALGRSRRELFSQMVDYFYKNKKDPIDLNDDVLKSTLVRSHKTYVGFIKNQEDLLLIPMKEAMDKMIANQKDIVRFFNEQVLGANKSILKYQLSQEEKFAATDQLLKILKEQMETKSKLKVKMLQILNGYIKAREELGSFKAKEKEELADRVRKQIESL